MGERATVTKKQKYFACIVVMARKGSEFNLPCFIIPFKQGARKRDRIIKWDYGEKATEKQIIFCLLAFQPY